MVAVDTSHQNAKCVFNVLGVKEEVRVDCINC